MADEIEKIKGLQPIQEALEKSGFIFENVSSHGSSYIFPDGRYLNLANNEEKITELLGNRGHVMAHHLLDRCISKLNLISEENMDLIRDYNDTLDKPHIKIILQQRVAEHTDKAIVLNDGTNFGWENSYIDLPVTGKPTTEQLNTLTLWVDGVMASSQEQLDVGYGSKVTSYRIKEDNHPMTDDIIKNIKKIYQMI